MSPRRTRSQMVGRNTPLLGQPGHSEEGDRSEARANRDRGKQPAAQTSTQEDFVTYEQFASVAHQLSELTRFVKELQAPPVEPSARPPLGIVPPPQLPQQVDPPRSLPRHKPARSGGRSAPARVDDRPLPELSGSTGSTSQRRRVPVQDRLGPHPRPTPRFDERLEEPIIPQPVALPDVNREANEATTPVDRGAAATMADQLAALHKRVETMAKAGPSHEEDRDYSTDNPLTDIIMRVPLPKRFSMPPVDPYDGSSDPIEHLNNFVGAMVLHANPDAIMCRAFPLTLKGAARMWFNNLPPRSVDSFRTMGKLFRMHFQGSRVQRKTSAHLMNMKQRPGESLRAFLGRFNLEVLQVKDIDEAVHFATLRAAVTDPRLKFSIAKKEPADLQELLARCEKFASANEIFEASKGLVDTSQKRLEDRAEVSRPGESKRARRDEARIRGLVQRKLSDYTPLNRSLGDIYSLIATDGYLRRPQKISTDAKRRDPNRYCHYHRDIGHTTDECRSLQAEIEDLISRGYYKQYIDHNASRAQAPAPEERRRLPPPTKSKNTRP